MMTRPLTVRQQAVYDFIRDKIVNRGYGPTVREIGEHLEIRSPNGVMCHLRALERKEMIRRLANKSRAIELTESINRQELVGLPLAGQATATACTLDPEAVEKVYFEAIFNRNDRFLLRVIGDSLRSEYLLSGDYLIVEKSVEALPGQLTVAKAADGQMMLQYWQPEGASQKLFNANATPAITLAEGLSIVGIVKGVVRELL